MGKVSKEVSEGLSAAIAEAQAKLNGSVAEIEGFPGENTVEKLLNSGAEAQKKRKRRTKAEMETAKQVESNDENSLFEALDLPQEEDNRPEWEKRNAVDHEEFCQWELEKAKLKGVPDPEFDFRNYYEVGTTIYYVHIMESLGEKEVQKLYLRTIYPRMMVGSEEKGCCECIGYNDRDKVFLTPRDADIYAKSITVTSKYGSEEPKSGSKRAKGIDEGVEDENVSEDAYARLQEALDD